jgi:uncharacterized protein
VLAIIAAIGAIFVGGGLWNATRDPVVVRHTITLPGLPRGSRITLALLSDTHQGHPDMPRARLERIIGQVNALHPDIVVLAGDYHGGKWVDFPRTRLEDALEPFARLRAPLGVFAVLGNHEEPAWAPAILRRQRGVQVLVNQHATAGPLLIAGLDTASGFPDAAAALAGAEPGRPVLLVFHEPSLVTAAPRTVALSLAGHTHGGQIDLPLLGSLGRFYGPVPACLRGMCRIDGRRLFVTSGIGTSTLPLRWGVPPEIVLLTLVAA